MGMEAVGCNLPEEREATEDRAAGGKGSEAETAGEGLAETEKAVAWRRPFRFHRRPR